MKKQTKEEKLNKDWYHQVVLAYGRGIKKGKAQALKQVMGIIDKWEDSLDIFNKDYSDTHFKVYLEDMIKLKAELEKLR